MDDIHSDNGHILNHQNDGTPSHLDAAQHKQYDEYKDNRANQTTADIHYVSLGLEFRDKEKQPLCVRASSCEAQPDIRPLLISVVSGALYCPAIIQAPKRPLVPTLAHLSKHREER
jgi:hypothetical protein